MTINSLLSTDKAEGDVPVAKAEALPLKGTKYLDPKFDEESQQQQEPIATVIQEATVIENLGWDKETRRIFIRKVYSILAVQLVASFGVCAFMALHQPTHVYVLTHAWPVITSIFLSFVLVMALMCFKDKHPQNMYLLAAFTFVEAFMVGTVTTAYAEENAGIVLEAVFLTGAIFIGLTVFTFQSKIDFSFLGAFLSMGLGKLLKLLIVFSLRSNTHNTFHSRGTNLVGILCNDIWSRYRLRLCTLGMHNIQRIHL